MALALDDDDDLVATVANMSDYGAKSGARSLARSSSTIKAPTCLSGRQTIAGFHNHAYREAAAI